MAKNISFGRAIAGGVTFAIGAVASLTMGALTIYFGYKGSQKVANKVAGSDDFITDKDIQEMLAPSDRTTVIIY